MQLFCVLNVVLSLVLLVEIVAMYLYFMQLFCVLNVVLSLVFVSFSRKAFCYVLENKAVSLFVDFEFDTEEHLEGIFDYTI
jgi:hypothetical protein